MARLYRNEWKKGIFKPVLPRLWANTTVQSNGCWTYLSGKDDIRPRICVEKRYIPVSRASWVEHRGAIPIDKWVLHTCVGNRRCWNPLHLYLGTPKTNAKDRDVQGRANTPYGDHHANSKLTSDAVIQIRSAPSSVTHLELAQRFGVSKHTVKNVRAYRSWNKL